MNSGENCVIFKCKIDYIVAMIGEVNDIFTLIVEGLMSS